MLFTVIETFRDAGMVSVYRRLRERGRMLPDGLVYRDSWIEPGFGRCFPLMECGDAALLQEWVLGWCGTGVTFEIVPVVSSARTRAIGEPVLDREDGAAR